MARSTNFAPAYARSNFMNVVSDLNGDTVLDTLSQKYIDMVRFITSWQDIIFTGEQMTTLSYRFYGTTTLWWLIVMFNGYYHWMEIQPGTTLSIPNKQDIDAYLNRKTTGAKGVRVTI